MKKTNALRKLDQEKIKYTLYEYDTFGEHFTGQMVADAIGMNVSEVFKTLVVVGTRIIVCMIPVEEELDLKKVAVAAKEKSVSMLPLKDLLPKTGYVKGGCSPIGMKKDYDLYIHESATDLEMITCSAGLIGLQMQVNRTELIKLRKMTVADLTK